MILYELEYQKKCSTRLILKLKAEALICDLQIDLLEHHHLLTCQFIFKTSSHDTHVRRPRGII